MYFTFAANLEEAISSALDNALGDGFYDFKPHQKFIGPTDIPNSNTDATPIGDYRTVFILETDFAPEDATLEAQAIAMSEYYTEDAARVHQFLSLPDATTNGKTKAELDLIIDQL